MKPKLNVCLLISFIIGVVYVVYIFSYAANTNASATSDTQAVGYAIATAIVMPHMVCTVIAVIFNALGLFLRKSVFALVGAILYAVAMVLMPLYFFFVIVEMILSFIGFSQLKKAQQNPEA